MQWKLLLSHRIFCSPRVDDVVEQNKSEHIGYVLESMCTEKVEIKNSYLMSVQNIK